MHINLSIIGPLIEKIDAAKRIVTERNRKIREIEGMSVRG